MTYDTNLTVTFCCDTWRFDKATRADIQGKQLVEIARAVLRLGWTSPGHPEAITSYTKHVAVSDDWFERHAEKANQLRAKWSDESLFLVDKGECVVRPDTFHTRVDPRGLVEGFTQIPFQIALVSHKRFYEDRTERPVGWHTHRGIAGVPFQLGLGLALRGRGHLALVSRRWLTHGGPWRVLRAANDTAFVQLYDLGASGVAAAWAQASASYHRITGSEDVSGIVALIGDGYIELPPRAKHDPGTKRLVVTVDDRDVSIKEMRDLCEYRFNSKVKPPEMKWLPVETIAYVFASEGRARHHRHELWLRDLECWYELDGRRTRIDDTYDPPPPPPPAWVAEADAREAKARSGNPG